MYILFVSILFVNDIFCFGLFHSLSLATAITQCTCTWSFFFEFQIAIIVARDYLFLKELDKSIDRVRNVKNEVARNESPTIVVCYP